MAEQTVGNLLPAACVDSAVFALRPDDLETQLTRLGSDVQMSRRVLTPSNSPEGD